VLNPSLRGRANMNVRRFAALSWYEWEWLVTWVLRSFIITQSHMILPASCTQS